MTDALFELSDLLPVKSVYAVHCFFNCGHAVREADPDSAAAAMERHYGETHTVDIDRALGLLGDRPATRRRRTP